MIANLKCLDWLLITWVTFFLPSTSSCFLCMAETQEHSMRVTTFSFYNDGLHLSLGSMNSLNVKVIHMGGTDPTLIGKFKDVRSFLSQNDSIQFSHSVVSDSETPWTTARQSSLSITNSQRLLKLMSIKSVMPSNHLILCHSLLLLPSIFSSLRVLSLPQVAKVLDLQL